eukprot:6081810-Amphidinium_carterae.1
MLTPCQVEACRLQTNPSHMPEQLSAQEGASATQDSSGNTARALLFGFESRFWFDAERVRTVP